MQVTRKLEREQANREKANALLKEAAESGGDVAGTFIKIAGFRRGGGKVKWGVLREAVDPGAVPSAEESAARREEAARELVNIDRAERDRRLLVGRAGLALSGALAVFAYLSGWGFFPRFAVVGPAFALSYGFWTSGRDGI